MSFDEINCICQSILHLRNPFYLLLIFIFLIKKISYEVSSEPHKMCLYTQKHL